MSAPDYSVNGQNVLISGGSGGIGTAFVKAFLACGAKVSICDLIKPKEDLDCDYYKIDVRNDDDVENLAKKIKKLDVLIHCAGKLIRHEEHQPSVFMDIVNIHLGGNLRLATAFRQHLALRKGCIINIGSMYSYFGASRIPAYSSAKTAIIGLTKSLAIAYAEDGIRVNAIAPGWIRTEISKGGREDEQFNALVMNRLPTKRWSEPEELAGTAVFLASPASKLINGVTIPVDGGYVAS
jgi:NAD(P)-dependent dehydrogenase (short-subunit alcohol dehydrogenase family)